MGHALVTAFPPLGGAKDEGPLVLVQLVLVNEQSEKLLVQTANESSLPHMELDDSSRLSTPPEMEPVMDCSLVLTTLSGVTIKVSLSVAKFDRFEDLEDQVMDYLVSVIDLP